MRAARLPRVSIIAVFAATIIAAACNRDRPLEPPIDFSLTPDLTLRDLSVVDLAAPDFRLPDLIVPDLLDRCPAGPSFVLVVDSSNVLSRFRPDTLQFFTVGKLACPTQPNATPYSMAVGRDQTAWVVYTSGELFRVDTNTAACAATMFAPNQLGVSTFGMGFALEQVGSDKETLYIASTGVQGQLGKIDLSTFQLSLLAPLTGNPELSGTDDAKLWGFFPDLTPPRVAAIDKQTGALSSEFQLASLQGAPQSWAFATWGGDAWIFLERQNEPSTSVHRLRSNGTLTTVLSNTGRHIIGAGVSTCSSGGGGG